MYVVLKLLGLGTFAFVRSDHLRYSEMQIVRCSSCSTQLHWLGDVFGTALTTASVVSLLVRLLVSMLVWLQVNPLADWTRAG